MGEALAQPVGFFHFLIVAEKGVHVLDADAGDDPLKGDPAVQGAAQVLEQRNILVSARGEVAVAALGGYGAMGLSVPDEQGFSKAGARGD